VYEGPEKKMTQQLQRVEKNVTLHLKGKKVEIITASIAICEHSFLEQKLGEE